MNCQDWYIIQQKQGEYTHESELICTWHLIKLELSHWTLNVWCDFLCLQERGAENVKIPEKSVLIELFGGSFLSCGTVMGLKVTAKPAAVLKKGHQRRQTGD